MFSIPETPKKGGAAMNETDLRVVKTKESIEQAFLSLLAKKPLQKISIVELAREARINKGTFYLHYTDIFDLYQKTIRRQMEAGFERADYFSDFFDDPKRFCEALTASFSSNLAVLDMLGKEESGASALMDQTLDLLRDKLYATGRIRPCPANDIKLDALFGALLICKPRYEREHGDEMDRIMLSMIANFKAD